MSKPVVNSGAQPCELDAEIADWLAAHEAPATEGFDVSDQRARLRRVNKEARGTMPDVYTVKDIRLGPGGVVPARSYRPHRTTNTDTTMLFFHGGGWVLGDLDTHDYLAARLCTGAGATVVSVDYRRAPEDPFPAAFDDCRVAVEWVMDHPDAYGTPDRFVVAGDSAGAQLAASVALAMRDAGRPLAAQVLVVPVTDVVGGYADAAYNATYPSRAGHGDGPGLTLRTMQSFADLYAPLADWRANPCGGQVAGVAAAVIHVADCDPLRDEGLAYARRLMRAEVPVIVRRQQHLHHGYAALGRISRRADQALDQLVTDLRAVLAQDEDQA